MKRYIGIKEVQAKTMTRGEYNEYRDWELPEDEGYLVVYPDGYESWCPKKQFEDANLDILYLDSGELRQIRKLQARRTFPPVVEAEDE